MVSDRIKILLQELGLSQRQFAMRINLDAGYFSKIVQGKVNPPNRILLLIETVFGVNKSWLEEGEGEIFLESSASVTKRKLLNTIELLNEEQLAAVEAFIKYLHNT